LLPPACSCADEISDDPAKAHEREAVEGSALPRAKAICGFDESNGEGADEIVIA